MGLREQGLPTIRIGAGPARTRSVPAAKSADSIRGRFSLAHIPPENAKAFTSIEHTQ